MLNTSVYILGLKYSIIAVLHLKIEKHKFGRIVWAASFSFICLVMIFFPTPFFKTSNTAEECGISSEATFFLIRSLAICFLKDLPPQMTHGLANVTNRSLSPWEKCSKPVHFFHRQSNRQFQYFLFRWNCWKQGNFKIYKKPGHHKHDSYE